MSTILLLEDDPILSQEVKIFLTNNGLQCDCVFDGSMAESQLVLKPYDCLILDINVPSKNGIEVCGLIREKNKQIAILMLTAFGEVKDKISAFHNGADDYLVKPFHFEELMARINALLRRKDKPLFFENVYQVADLVINFDTKEVLRNGIEIKLSPKEFQLLSILAKANGRVLPKSHIAEVLWDYHIETNQNTIEVYINFLRKKIDKDFDNKLIHTKVGYGYYLKE